MQGRCEGGKARLRIEPSDWLSSLSLSVSADIFLEHLHEEAELCSSKQLRRAESVDSKDKAFAQSRRICPQPFPFPPPPRYRHLSRPSQEATSSVASSLITIRCRSPKKVRKVLALA